ncbi:hypothetical protein ERO13_D04G022236v2 [Gossypium hirsutum]|uniref:Uncharacterized protein n=2 Tax=Gossypium TaxID=3633 RepID=A0A0D2RWY3_GOSRA|nr:hypothetical protein ERO13_D04G022236v2 [Gossypium hirsutum]KJB75267.1 hypothetical protein B456_012G034700 [Gossypium raimondii]TYI85979.1 hypothetical protein E1A91_D04G035900v1 [Gossypium mustelinum]
MVRLIHSTIAKSSLSTLARTSLLHLSPLRSTSLTRDNATESVAIEGGNTNFSVNTRQGKMVPILKDCSIPSDSCGCFLDLMVVVNLPL